MPSASEASLYMMQNLIKNVATNSASEISYHTIHKSIENVFFSNELES